MKKVTWDGLAISEAIKRYNTKSRGKEKMTIKKLAEIVLPEYSSAVGIVILSKWNNGYDVPRLEPNTVKKICKTLGVDLNYIFR